MNLLMLAVLKKTIDDRNAAAARARRKRKNASEKNKKGSGAPYSSSYNQNRYSELEHFYRVVADDPILAAFFQAIEKKGDEIDAKDAEEVRKRIEIGLKEQAERVDKLEATRKEIKDLGLDVSYIPNYGPYITVGEKVLESGNRAFGEKGEYAKVSKNFKLKYDGIILSEAWFRPENRDINPFDEIYENWCERNSDLDARIAEKKAEVKRQEKVVKYGLLKKYERQDELDKLRKELEKFESEKRDGEEIKRKKDAFAKITPEQKEKIHEYYQLVAECSEKGKEIDEDVREYNEIKRLNSGYYSYSYNKKASAEERNKWSRAVDELIAEGELSEELLDAVDTIISEENIGYEKYSDGYDSYQMSSKGYSEKYRGAISWFIKTRREKIALKALQRKENAYKALEVEHKKLCDAAGLVDRAEELEGKVLPEEGDGEYGE